MKQVSNRQQSDQIAFGRKVREARNQKGFTLRDAANLLGISFTYLSKLETAATNPPSETLILSIAELFQIDQDNLFGIARKVQTEISEIIFLAHVPSILRQIKQMTAVERQSLILELQNKTQNLESKPI